MIEGIKTKQDLFDFVARHLFNQHAKSIVPVVIGGLLSPACKYRGDEGRKCAIGCLIEDAEYQRELENDSLHKVIPSLERSIGRQLLIDADNPHHEVRLLIALQHVHDRCHVSVWPTQLKIVSHVFDLEFNFTEEDWKECVTCH